MLAHHFWYGDLFVCTHGEVDKRGMESVTVTADDPVALVNKLKQEFKGRVWVVGGGGLAATLMNGFAIDEIILTLVPTVLGTGIRLFGEGDFEQIFRCQVLFSRPYLSFRTSGSLPRIRSSRWRNP